MTQGNVHTVLACITAVTVPKSMEEFEDMVRKNTVYGRRMTDMESLLTWQPRRDIAWSGLKHMQAGDILLFYHTVSSTGQAKRLLNQARQDHGDMVLLLEQASHHAEKYAGSIFGCGLVGDESEWGSQPDKGAYHFNNRYFAPLDQITIFPHPLRRDQFEDAAPIRRGTSITTFKNAAFQILKQRLISNGNTLPDYLSNAVLAQ